MASASYFFTGALGAPLSADWNTLAGGLEIAAGPGARSTAGGALVSYAIWITDTFSANTSGLVTISIGSADGAAGYIARASLNNYYEIVCNGSVYGSGFYLGKVVAGVETLIANYGNGVYSNGDTIRLDVDDTTLRGYRNAVSAGADQSDASLASGQSGFMSYTSGGLVEIIWLASDLAATPVGPLPFITTLSGKRLGPRF